MLKFFVKLLIFAYVSRKSSLEVVILVRITTGWICTCIVEFILLLLMLSKGHGHRLGNVFVNICLKVSC